MTQQLLACGNSSAYHRKHKVVHPCHLEEQHKGRRPSCQFCPIKDNACGRKAKSWAKRRSPLGDISIHALEPAALHADRRPYGSSGSQQQQSYIPLVGDFPAETTAIPPPIFHVLRRLFHSRHSMSHHLHRAMLVSLYRTSLEILQSHIDLEHEVALPCRNVCQNFQRNVCGRFTKQHSDQSSQGLGLAQHKLLNTALARLSCKAAFN